MDSRPPTSRFTTLDGPGWYPFGRQSRVAEWDGEKWTGTTAPDDSVTELPKWHRRPFAFLAHRWWWVFLVGWAVVLASGWWADSTDVGPKHSGMMAGLGYVWSHPWSYPAAVGFAISAVGFIMLLTRRIPLPAAVVSWQVIGWGIVGGVVSMFAAMLVETAAKDAGLSSSGLLWLSGPIEESAKLLVPALLWLAVAGRLRQPLVGFWLVVIGASVFGLLEGVTYLSDPKHGMGLVMGAARTPAELLHPIATGLAAAVIWLAAARAGRLWTWAGLAGWVVAMVVHAVHNGIATLGHDSGEGGADLTGRYGILAAAVVNVIAAVVLSYIAFLLMRPAARELVSPSQVPANAPRWRPHLAAWGLGRGHGTSAASTPAPDSGGTAMAPRKGAER